MTAGRPEIEDAIDRALKTADASRRACNSSAPRGEELLLAAALRIEAATA